eukprot:gene14996-biopygen7493
MVGAPPMCDCMRRGVELSRYRHVEIPVNSHRELLRCGGSRNRTVNRRIPMVGAPPMCNCMRRGVDMSRYRDVENCVSSRRELLRCGGARYRTVNRRFPMVGAPPMCDCMRRGVELSRYRHVAIPVNSRLSRRELLRGGGARYGTVNRRIPMLGAPPMCDCMRRGVELS